jgi:hypothetical protein
MTEVEKLRALLAEARPILWLHRPAGDMDCDCRECSAVVEVVARIDAAIAESPSGDMRPDVVEQRQAEDK